MNAIRVFSVGAPSVICLTASLYGQFPREMEAASPLTVQTRPAQRARGETLIFDGKVMPLGAGQASDPSLMNISGAWQMLFTTVKWVPSCAASGNWVYQIRQTAASLPPGHMLSDAAWQMPSNGATYMEFVQPGPAGSWDQDAIESPKIVTGYDPTAKSYVTRIYYTGWRRVPVSTDTNGCPNFGYSDWKIGMAEWNNTARRWVKRTSPVLSAIQPWEQTHYVAPDGTRVAYGFLGDQSVVYVPAPNGAPGTWHLYYQAMSDLPSPRFVTVHAVSSDGINWPAQNRSILPTNPPTPSGVLPGGPYSVDVSVINGRFYFVGWIPNTTDPSSQGLWLTSSSTPGGTATGDFHAWVPLLYDNNGTWWHSADAVTLASHQAGLVAPTLLFEAGALWLYYSGVRRENDGSFWTSIGRAAVDLAALQ